MSQRMNRRSTLAAARADYLWCVQARLIDRSEDGWREFLAGYLSMEQFLERRVLSHMTRAVA
ncbi:MAG TPA: hypothetical protein VF215_00775 [Thermoanaerobaculia bacterium]